jgi:hypothetical protein
VEAALAHEEIVPSIAKKKTPRIWVISPPRDGFRGSLELYTTESCTRPP